MAGKPVGSIFVELDLDASRYTRAQKTLLKDATTTSLSIEKNFKNLGVKSSAEFDLMRAKISNSYNMIANNSKATANDIVRAEQAKNAKLKALNEQQYGVHKSFLTKMKTDYAVLWTAVAAGAVAAGYAMTNVAKESISAASKLEEVTSKFNVVFKDQQKEAEKWAATLVDGFAMSTRESKQYLSSIQDLLVPMGMASNEAGKLSFEVVKLSADLGSFNNMPTATVMRDIESALVGNFETMKKYGVVLNETVVAQQAMAMGFGETKKEIDASEKAQAAYALMVKGSTAAIGDQQRTMGSYANQLKQWNANVEELTGLLGNELLPVATEYLKALNDWVKVNDELIKQKVPEYVENAVTAVKALAKAVEFVSKAISKSTGFSTLLDIYALLAKANEDLEKGSNVVWGKIPKQVSDAATGIETSGNVIITKFSALVKEWEELNDVADDFNDIWGESFDIDYGFDPVLAAIQEREIAVNNLKFALDRATDSEGNFLKNLAAEDTYDADYDGQNLTIQAAADLQNELNDAKNESLKIDSAAIDGYTSMASAISDMGSASQETISGIQAAAQGLALIQAVVAVVTQGEGDPYTAWARIAAMAATMAGYLSQAGVSFSAGSGSSYSKPSTASTVLGAAEGEMSTSTENVLELLEDIHADEYEMLEGIYSQVKNLNDNITGLVTEIARSGGMAANFVMPTFGDTDGEVLWEYLIDIGLGTGPDALPLNEWLNDVLGNLGEEIFGGAQSAELVDWGVIFANATLDSLTGLDQQDMYGLIYGIIETVTDGGWFSGDSTDTDVQYTDLEQNIIDMFTDVFSGIGETLLSLADVFGTSINDALSYVFTDIEISFEGMDSDEINDALVEFFSAQADTAAEVLFGSFIGKYQQLDEGMFETAVRVATEYATVMDILETTGIQLFSVIADTNMYWIDLTQTLIDLAGGIDALTESASAYYDAFFTDEEKFARLYDGLSTAMGDLGLSLPDTREGFRELVEGIDLSTESGQALYIALLAMAESAGIYYDITEEAADDAAQAVEDAADALRDLEAAALSSMSAVTDMISDWLGLESNFDFSTLSEENIVEYSSELAAILTNNFNALTAEYAEWENLQNKGEDLENEYGALFDDVVPVLDRIPKLLDQSLEGITQYYEDLEDWLSDAEGVYNDLSSVIENISDMMVSSGIMDYDAAISEGLSELSELSIEDQIIKAQELADLVKERYDIEIESMDAIETTIADLSSIIDSIDQKIIDLKYSMFNLSLPTTRAALASGDYASYLSAAKTGGASSISSYLAFVDTYLQESMDAYKSSEAYQEIYTQVQEDLKNLGLDTNDLLSSEEQSLNSIETSAAEMNETLEDILEVLRVQQENLQSAIEGSLGGFDDTSLSDIQNTISSGLSWISALLSGDIYTALESIAAALGVSSGTGYPEGLQSVVDDLFGNVDLYGQTLNIRNDEQIYLDRTGTVATYMNPNFADFSFGPNTALSDIYQGNEGIQKMWDDLIALQNAGYASGGVAMGPDSGHLELLHGTEAVIPLDGGGIPVRFLNGGSNKPVTVNVIIDGEKISVREIQTVADELITVKALRGVLDKRVVL